MKKLALLLALLLALASFAPVFAELEWGDPALCVAGKWLVVDAAAPSAVELTVPEGTVYGDQVAGGCSTPAATAVLPLSVVTEKGGGHKLTVRVDGSSASPMVTVTYGSESQTQLNDGGTLKFKFK